MQPFLPKKLTPIAFGFLLATIMTFIISGISNVIALGISDPSFMINWMQSWAVTWVIAFPTVVFVAPAVRRFVESLTVK
ncbi:MAG: DUF2798 domain-containing protein [Salaquimonas sp.]